VDNIIACYAQTVDGLRVLKSCGKYVVIDYLSSKCMVGINYTAANRQRLHTSWHPARTLFLQPASVAELAEEDVDDKLFYQILLNNNYVLNRLLLVPRTVTSYNLRQRQNLYQNHIL